jgi:hypothetical protein
LVVGRGASVKDVLLGPQKGETRLWVWGRRWSRWRTIRVWLLLIWFLSLLVWSVSRSASTLRFLEVLSATVFTVLSWPWIRGPYLLYSHHALPLRAGYETQSANATLPEFDNHVSRAVERLGFKPAGVLTAKPVYSRLGIRVMMYVHPENKDSAQIGRIERRSGILPVLVFKRRFADGFAFETSNSRSAPISPPDPIFRVFRFPQLRSVSDLYRVHRKIKEEIGTNRVPSIANEEQELNEFVSRAKVVHQRDVSSGYRLNTVGDRYKPTIRGAIRRAWLLTWPVKPFRQMQVESEGTRKATALGLPIHPKVGCLEESLRHPSNSGTG